MKTKTTIFLTLLAVLTCGSLYAADGDGGYAGAFYQVPIGARPTAMGGAYRAISDDGAAPLYNPAGLAGLKTSLFSSSYRLMKLDRQVGYVTLMFPAKGNSALGLHWRYAGSGAVDVRNADGDKLGREISMNSHDFAVVFAKRFAGPFAAGVKMYYLHSGFADMKAFSVGFDAGFMLHMDHLLHERGESEGSAVRDIQLGLTLKYFEAKYIWKNEEYVFRYIDGSSFGTEQEDKIPVEIGLGTSARLRDGRLLLAGDLVKNSKQGVAVHLGGEYIVKPEFALRGGFSDGRFTVGTGYIFNLSDRVLGIDYAFSTDRADEGSEHVFSFELKF
ncbi:MAG: PorV/PorQ family protein [candidate division Zixibacteria bacterium]|nr:PorV/PorQ family protein [candidate division Zixibacteria bacterium]MDH3938032.1 PorV/PorQ family protein [candidate division Zixibacteria bacterium]MDH4035129.1 PorV/PorQ family protein [candidate division Zixibacteria bacterium]